MLNFNEVSQRFGLSGVVYQGVQDISLSKIVGSQGRYQDFDHTFLPTTAAMEERWRNVASLYLDPNAKPLPPIDVYQVGDAYFVRDGNHRVSVANQLGYKDIEAKVWQYKQRVYGLERGKDIRIALMETEHQCFLDQTGLDKLRPESNIRLTELGGYEHLLGQILYYRHVLTEIDGHEPSYEEAVEAWYDMLFGTTIQLIEESGILNRFSNRTPADFFIWVLKRQREMEECYGEELLLEEVILDLREQVQSGLAPRAWRVFRRWFKRSRVF